MVFRGKRNLRAALVTGLLSASCIGVAYASPWVEADDVYLRASLQQLADAGYLRSNMATFPLMWSGIARDLREIDASQLNASEQLAFYRVRAALSFAQQERVDSLRVQGSSERVRSQGFADTYYEHAAITGARAFVGQHTAARLQTTLRMGINDHKHYTFDGSYLATTLGNWAFSVDAMPVWWGPGQKNALVLSTNSRPVQAFRFNRLQDDVTNLPGLAWLGNWHATGFYGRTQNAGPLGDQEIAGGRVSVKPWKPLTLASSYTVEAGSGLGNRKQILGVDGRLALPYSIAVYAEVAQRQGASRVTKKRAYTWGVDHFLRFGRDLQQVFVEYSDIPAYFYDDQTDPLGYRRWQQNMGAASDQDVQSLSIGYRIQHPDGRAWRISLQDQSVGGTNRLVAFQHDLGMGRFKVDRQVADVKFQQALGDTLLSIGVAYTRDRITESPLASMVSKTTEHDFSVRIGWEFRY